MSIRKGLLVVNAGSSSIKFAVFAENLAPVSSGKLANMRTDPHFSAQRADGGVIEDSHWPAASDGSIDQLIDRLVAWLRDHLRGGQIEAIGHRVAIGGLEHSGPVLVTPQIMEKLRAMIPLAPLHQPVNLALIDKLAQAFGDMPQLACFDTAFHRTMPPEAQTYALPAALRQAGACRYGFHGLSYEFIASQLPQLDPAAARGKTVVAHLGSGASMCALSGGCSIATSMGFSPLSGLVMATRCGDLDPGLMIWLLRERGMTVDQVEAMLYHDSGLKGISGQTGDMQQLLDAGDPAARLAVDIFTYRVSTQLGALCAALEGLDALVFTAGIGENAPAIRAAICARASWLGVRIDDAANGRNACLISTAGSAVPIYVVPTNEEKAIAGHMAAMIATWPVPAN